MPDGSPDIPLGVPVAQPANLDALEELRRRVASIALNEQRRLASAGVAAAASIHDAVDAAIDRKLPAALYANIAKSATFQTLAAEVEAEVRRRSAAVVADVAREEVARRSLSRVLEAKMDERARAATWAGALWGTLGGFAAATLLLHWRQRNER